MKSELFRDPLEQASTENHLRAISRALEQSTVIVRDCNGTIRHWTAGCQRLYGWTSEEANGRSCAELLRTVFPVSLQEIERQLGQTGSWNGELEQVRKDGTRVFVSTNWLLTNGFDDHRQVVIETHSDVTPRLEMQRELEAANRKLKAMAGELEASNKELEEFARIASHDLNAPIISTRWTAELLEKRHGDGLNEAGRQCLRQITEGLDRMLDLVEAILAHARFGKGAIASTESIHAEDALGIALENLRKHIVISGAQIEYDSLPEVTVEEQALSQLFQNLISNAIKYRQPEQTPIIHVSAIQQGRMWRFAVKDNGIGIESAWLERIFIPLQRLHGREIAGSGIGLATCKKIVTRVGGRIWAESRLGAGSTFYFTLPGSGASGSMSDESLDSSQDESGSADPIAS